LHRGSIGDDDGDPMVEVPQNPGRLIKCNPIGWLILATRYPEKVNHMFNNYRLLPSSSSFSGSTRLDKFEFLVIFLFYYWYFPAGWYSGMNNERNLAIFRQFK
jgi:hypothetical protein